MPRPPKRNVKGTHIMAASDPNTPPVSTGGAGADAGTQEEFSGMTFAARRKYALETISVMLERQDRLYSLVAAVTDRLKAVHEDLRDNCAVAICETMGSIAMDVAPEGLLQRLLACLRELDMADVVSSPTSTRH